MQHCPSGLGSWGNLLCHSASVSAQNRVAVVLSLAKREIRHNQCRRMWFNAQLRQNILMQMYHTKPFVRLSRSTDLQTQIYK